MVQQSDIKSTPFYPGIILITGDYIGSETEKKLSRIIGVGTESRYVTNSFELRGNIKGWLMNRSQEEGSFYLEDNDLVVWVDGYISDISDIKMEYDYLKYPAFSLAMLYKKIGIAFLRHLKGSYSFLLMERKTETIHVVVDRRGSRPYFFSSLNKRSLFLSPDIELIISSNKNKCKIDYSSACAFISSGRFYDRKTLFKDIKKLGQAKNITVNKNGFEINRYYTLKFNENIDINDKKALVESFDTVLRKAVKRILSATKNQFLFLSGGIDSRVVLSYLLSENIKIPVVSFGMNAGPKDDREISEAVAKKQGLELLKYELEIEDFGKYAEKVVKWTGSIVEVIDSPSLVNMWKDLGTRFDTFINGDECFGWKPYVDSYEKALNSNMIFRMNQMSRLCRWLNKNHKKDIIKRIDNNINSLIKNNKMPDPNNTKDLLYYKERLYNEVNAFTAPKLKIFEQARPLIDEDVIDFISGLPPKYRCKKELYISLLKIKFPDLLSPGFAAKTSLPQPAHYQKLFEYSNENASFIKQELFDHMNDGLEGMLDRKIFQEDVRAIISRDNLTPLSNRWNRLPGLWRLNCFQLENRTDPILLVLRILQLSIYLNKINNNMSKINSYAP
ncbi:asparagine synthetase B family protein [Desulfospira joergensenii]|uniref:asparagine synthase-related protein n=1 Tax=Desulfospira joergensenii TaxID=53329 RepID=UPI0003B78A96|nr:asparagine synthetase B family protein [Desulfospira joergensenii]